MKRALCLVRDALVYRRAAFVGGLRAAGYDVVRELSNPMPEDVLVIWNRYGDNDVTAHKFERAGARVVVTENGYLGKSWLGDRWFALAIGQHAGAGQWTIGGSERWDDLCIELSPWRTEGWETIVLAQRGIGSPQVRSPDQWAQQTQKKYGGRIRAHPGKLPPKTTLEEDLKDAKQVITWNSSAAFLALMLGVPVWHAFSKWLGASACRSLSEWGQEPKCNDEDRLQMFRSLIWAMWRANEIEDGTAFKHLLGSS